MTGVGYVFAGGGTGGHLFPGLAVAAAVRRREPDAAILFYTTDRPLDRDLLARTPYLRIPQTVRPFSMRPWRWPAFLTAWNASVAAALAAFAQRRPHVVLGLGGYSAGPPVVAARKLGIRSAILNPDAVPGRANRFLARRCDLIAIQWEASRRHFSRAAACAALGCPIRAEFGQPIDKALARRHFGLDEDARRPVVLVTGASQGARTINQAMPPVWAEFTRRHAGWQILHLTGLSDEEATRAGYNQARVTARVIAFTHEMWLALGAADLVVSRAGASTLAELTALGRPSILLPYPYHRDRHQDANARVLVEARAALLVEDQRAPEKNRDSILAALEACAPDAIRERMAAAARTLGRPNAAEEIAGWLIEGDAGALGPAAGSGGGFGRNHRDDAAAELHPPIA